MDWLRDFRKGVKNLIAWFPIIWVDRSWDYGFLFYMLRKKLALMEDAIRNGIYEGCEKDADKIHVCVLLLDRITEDDCAWAPDREQDVKYLFSLMGKHVLKWWD